MDEISKMGNFTDIADIKADYPIRSTASEEVVRSEVNRIASFCKKHAVDPHHYVFLNRLLDDKEQVEGMCTDAYEYDINVLEYFRLYSAVKSTMVDDYRGMGKNNFKDLIYLIDKKK